MSIISVLDPLVAQQVAAGEVVERPASVIKELVENSLDAGASRVEIDLKRAGAERMAVTDDGSGMDREDAEKSVLRHATSKIRSVDNLHEVKTLGFRGEALPSIASVSLFNLISSTGQGAATRVFVDAGRATEVSRTAHPKGTTVSVEQLFFNVPARKAFMKSARAERAAILEVMTHLAVVHPHVSFKVVEEGRTLLSLPGCQTTGPAGRWREPLRERLAQVWGMERAGALKALQYTQGPFALRGFVTLPSVTDPHRRNQTLAVNGRWVKAESLLRGLDDAYRTTLPGGRYPPVALFVSLDPHEVDVNVHPAKQLVRFSDERGARQMVADAVRAAISTTTFASSSTTAQTPAASHGPRPDKGPPAGARSSSSGASRDGRLLERHAGREQPASLTPAVSRQQALDTAAKLSDYQKRLREATHTDRHHHEDQEQSQEQRAEPPAQGALPVLDELRVVGQLHATFILVEDQQALWVVDQHVAHERAILDRLAHPGDDGREPPGVQPLLVPEVVELSAGEAEEAEEYLEDLAIYGFEAERFGPASYRITSVISTLAEGDVPGAFRAALAAARAAGPGHEREERILATVACHSAVKLGDRLSQPEMESLVKDWLTSRLPATCPHGRSICYRMSVKELARKFDRKL